MTEQTIRKSIDKANVELNEIQNQNNNLHNKKINNLKIEEQAKNAYAVNIASIIHDTSIGASGAVCGIILGIGAIILAFMICDDYRVPFTPLVSVVAGIMFYFVVLGIFYAIEYIVYNPGYEKYTRICNELKFQNSEIDKTIEENNILIEEKKEEIKKFNRELDYYNYCYTEINCIEDLAKKYIKVSTILEKSEYAKKEIKQLKQILENLNADEKCDVVRFLLTAYDDNKIDDLDFIFKLVKMSADEGNQTMKDYIVSKIEIVSEHISSGDIFEDVVNFSRKLSKIGGEKAQSLYNIAKERYNEIEEEKKERQRRLDSRVCIEDVIRRMEKEKEQEKKPKVIGPIPLPNVEGM